jgi:hypothetical protein
VCLSKDLTVFMSIANRNVSQGGLWLADRARNIPSFQQGGESKKSVSSIPGKAKELSSLPDRSPKIAMGEQLPIPMQLPAEEEIDGEVVAGPGNGSDSEVEWSDEEWQGCM